MSTLDVAIFFIATVSALRRLLCLFTSTDPHDRGHSCSQLSFQARMWVNLQLTGVETLCTTSATRRLQTRSAYHRLQS